VLIRADSCYSWIKLFAVVRAFKGNPVRKEEGFGMKGEVW